MEKLCALDMCARLMSKVLFSAPQKRQCLGWNSGSSESSESLSLSSSEGVLLCASPAFVVLGDADGGCDANGAEIAVSALKSPTSTSLSEGRTLGEADDGGVMVAPGSATFKRRL